MRISLVKRLRLAAFCAGLAILASTRVLAAEVLQVTAEQAVSIQQITDYINGFQNLQGDFTQVSPKGSLSHGVFFISKPGKMRFEYAAPNPFLIVADGTWLTIKNRAKEKGDQFPLSETPLRLVLGNKVDLLNDTNILGFEETDGLTSVTLEDKEGLMGGKLILVFDHTRNTLQQWVIIDSKNRRTTVSLDNIVAGVDPDPKLFVVKINRKERDQK
ncbi:MAG: LolA family protein [Aestuariivirga sp.]